MADKSEKTPRQARTPAGAEPYEDKPFVGTFRLLQGKHREGGVTYRPGQVFQSKSDLMKQNQAGAAKFEKVEEGRARSRAPRSPGTEVEGVSEVRGVAPHGQVSTGFQETSGKGRYQTRPEDGDPNLTTPPLTLGEQRTADLERRAAAAEGEESDPAAGRDFFGHSEDELHDLTVPELKQLAEREDIDLSGASRKDEILEKIKAEAPR